MPRPSSKQFYILNKNEYKNGDDPKEVVLKNV